MSIKAQTYLELLKICLQDEPKVTNKLINLSNGHIDWIDLLDFAARQGVIGVYWRGIELIFKSPTPLNKPTDDEVMEWWGEVNDIKKRNEELFKKTAFVSNTFRKEGFENCILKGQGNATMYPDPYLRTPGDIDIWLKGSKTEINSYVHKLFPKEKGSGLHIHFPIFKDTLIEVHYTPRILDNPSADRCLQQYFKEVQSQQMNNIVDLPIGNSISIPTPYFNIILQITHIYRHFICEGITLKHIVDYYYLLIQFYNWQQQYNLNEDSINNILQFLKKLKVLRFTKVIMYIMQEGLGIEEKYLFTTPNKRIGKLLLESIIEENGSLGLKSHKSLSDYNSVKERVQEKIKRTLLLIPYFPEETIWSIYYRTKTFYHK